MSVDLPAPLGPSRPMAWPRSSPVSPSRTRRPPSRTSNRSSWITGSITGAPNDETAVGAVVSFFARSRVSSLGWFTPMSLPYEIAVRLVPVIEQRADCQEIKSEQAAVARHFNAVFLAECADRRGPRVRSQLANGVRRFAAELLQDRIEHRAQVLVRHGGVILILVLG